MTEATKHTPGTWKTGGIMTRVEVRPEGWNVPMCIADCHAKYSPESGAERVANARLIAAAPDLLEACEAVAEVLGKLPIGDPLIGEAHTACKKARAAIAKATGR